MMKGARRSAPSPPPRLIPRRGNLQDIVTPGEDSEKPHKYIHVHHYASTNLFGAWFNDPSKPGKKQRLFFGCHQTAYLAARAQDRAALKYKPYALDPSSIDLNFREQDYAEDKELRKMLTNEEFGELLRKESRPKYTKMEHTPCLRKFLEEEAAKGNIPALPVDDRKKISLKTYLEGVMRKRNMQEPHVQQPEGESSAEESESDPEYEYDETDEESEDGGSSHEVPDARTGPGRQMKPTSGRFSSMAEILTKRSRSEATPLTVVEPMEPLASKWGQKRARSDATKSPLTPRTVTESTKVVCKLPAKLQYKMQKIEKSNAKTREEAAAMESEEPVPERPFRTKLEYKLNKINNKNKNTKSPRESIQDFERLVSVAAEALVNIVEGSLKKPQ